MAQRKPTKAELEYGRLRSTAAGLPSTTTKKQLKGTAKRIVATAAVAANLTPSGRTAKTVAQFATKTKATKLASGASKIKTKTFTQGDRARITNTPPKRSGAGKNSPVRGTKVEVKYKTKELSAKQQANLTTGRVVRERGKQITDRVKGAAAGAAGVYTVSELKKAKDAKKKGK